MSLRKLSHLVGLVEAGSFAKAAEALHLSQPALSRSIEALELELGARLVDRGYGQVRLTAAGVLVLERAQRLLREMREMRRDIVLAESGTIGQVRVGLGPFAAAVLVQPVLSRLIERHPRLLVEIDVSDTQALRGRLEAEQIDLFIADTRGLPRSPELRVENLPQVLTSFFVCAEHPLAGQTAIALDRLLDYPVAAPRLAAVVLRHFEEQLTRQDRGLISIVCDDMGALRQLARTSQAVILAPHETPTGAAAEPPLVRLDVEVSEPLYTRYGIVTLARRKPSPVAQVFVRLVHEVLEGAR